MARSSPDLERLQPTATKIVRRRRELVRARGGGEGFSKSARGGAARMSSRSYLPRFCSESSVLSIIGKPSAVAFQWYLTHPI